MSQLDELKFSISFTSGVYNRAGFFLPHTVGIQQSKSCQQDVKETNRLSSFTQTPKKMKGQVVPRIFF